MTCSQPPDRPVILAMPGGLADKLGKNRGLLNSWELLRAMDLVETLSLAQSRELDAMIIGTAATEIAQMDLPAVVRHIGQSRYVPVVVVGGGLGEHQRCELLNAGADDVVASDISPAELAARIQALLRVKRLHDELIASRAALQKSLYREQALRRHLRQETAYLKELCATDPLTHVQNVRSFTEIVAHEFRVAKRYDQAVSLLMLDLDHFKVVNDSHGHPAGDYVLKELAVILKTSVRDSDVVARTGGEEFSVLLPKADRRQARQFAERIRKKVSGRKFIVYGQTIHVTVSIGSASFPQDAEITEESMLCFCADQSLLTAKEHGRDRVVGFHELDRAERYRIRQRFIAAQPPEDPVEASPATTPACRLEQDAMRA
ncbi:MAG: diguanylate cyclase [Phycisphaerae bacterium]